MRLTSFVPSRWLLPLWLIAVLLAAPLWAIAQDEKPAKEDDEDKPRERPAAEEATEVVIHEWNFWIADPTTERINAADLYPANLPAQVETIRSRKMPQGIVLPSPLSMMTFAGKPVSDIEIDLRVSAGRVLAHWPPAKYKNGRLRWLDYSLGENLDDAPALIVPPAEHWFTEARAGGLYLKSKARAERFLTYDVELNFNTNLKLAGGPEKYEITNPGPLALSDVLISVPSPEGRRVGWLDSLPVTKGAAQPAASPTPVPQPAPGVPMNAVPAPGAVAPPAAAAPAAAVKVEAKVEVKAEAAEKKADNTARGAAAEAEAKAQSEKAEAVKQEVIAKEAAAKQAAEAIKAAAEAEKAPATNPKPAPTPADAPAPAATSPSVKPAEAKPAESKPAEAKPADGKTPQPVGTEVVMSEPLKAGSDQYTAQTVESLKARLVKAGLTDAEAALMLSIYAKSIFESEDLVVIYRVPQSLIDEKLPLAVYPDAKRIVRVGLVLVRNLDPKIGSDIQQLVAQLGDPKYPVREKAAQRLTALGTLATPALKEAAKSSDAEVQFRAERILQEQEPDENGQPRNRPRAVRVLRAG